MRLRFFLLPLTLSQAPAAAPLPSYAFALQSESVKARPDMSLPRRPLQAEPKLQLPDFDVPPPPSWALEEKRRKRPSHFQPPQARAPEWDPKAIELMQQRGK
ncbi:hypothetical protein [Chromobacterium sp. ATCC 53434]|uniref:hypothetical protein n=1 Tax=Chromobacterium sp. (strain ATCC 53434 / SC 14030) TaxID=2059672 RepID=UPI001305251B|nr:hypothetical protein [Chromobacterium sp. ATCC 53434]